MNCVYKEDDVQTKMVQEWSGYNMKNLSGELTLGGRESTGGFFQVWKEANFCLEQLPPSPL